MRMFFDISVAVEKSKKGFNYSALYYYAHRSQVGPEIENINSIF